MNVRNNFYYLAEFNGFYPSFHQKFMEMDLCSQMLWCLSKRRNAEEMLMVIIIEEKYKSEVDVGVGYWRWSWNFSFITLVRCAVQILSVEIQAWKFSFWLMKKSQRRAHQASAVAWLCTSKMLTAVLKCVGVGISLLIGEANEDQSVLVILKFKVGITLNSRRRYYVCSLLLGKIP